MSHPGYDASFSKSDSPGTTPGEPVEPAYSGPTDQVPSEETPAPPANPAYPTQYVSPTPAPAPYTPTTLAYTPAPAAFTPTPPPAYTPSAADPNPWTPTPAPVPAAPVFSQPTPPPPVTPTFGQAAPPVPTFGQVPPPSSAPTFGQPASPPAPPATPTFSQGQATVGAPQPGYSPTAAFQPVPAPPTYDPAAMAQQYSAPPTSGPYGYGMMPMSAMPGPPAPPRKSGAVITLAILTAVFLVAAGVMGTLFVTKTKQANDLNAKVATLTSDVAAEKTKSEGLSKDLESTKRDLTDAKGQSDELASQKKVIADCINAIFDLSDALSASGGKSNADVLAKESVTNTKCNAAHKFL